MRRAQHIHNAYDGTFTNERRRHVIHAVCAAYGNDTGNAIKVISIRRLVERRRTADTLYIFIYVYSIIVRTAHSRTLSTKRNSIRLYIYISDCVSSETIV